MAGDIFLKEGTIATLEANGGSLATGTAVDANDATLDVRGGGLSGAVQNPEAQFEFVCQWATITSIVLGTVAAELYLVPALDGTNYPDVNVTGGSSALPMPGYVGNFTCVKTPTADTNMRFVSPPVRLRPWLYKAYILNRSGQTISAAWTLKVMSARHQYT
jgi:hypothetical protein